jgi:hypothetical protein
MRLHGCSRIVSDRAVLCVSSNLRKALRLRTAPKRGIMRPSAKISLKLGQKSGQHGKKVETHKDKSKTKSKRRSARHSWRKTETEGVGSELEESGFKPQTEDNNARGPRVRGVPGPRSPLIPSFPFYFRFPAVTPKRVYISRTTDVLFNYE